MLTILLGVDICTFMSETRSLSCDVCMMIMTWFIWDVRYLSAATFCWKNLCMLFWDILKMWRLFL